MQITEDSFSIYSILSTENIKLLGRNSTYRDAAVLFWTGCGFTVNLNAGEIWAELEGDYDSCEPWASVWVDGVQVSRFIVQKGRNWYCLFRGLTPGAAHEISLLKETQAMSGDTKHSLLVYNVAVPKWNENQCGGKSFLPVKEKKYKIEYIGDSITTGEGIYGDPSEQDWITGWMGLDENYFMLVSKALDAEPRVVSQCGWGIFSAYNNDRRNAIPPVYEKVCGLAYGEQNELYGSQKEYDFSSWKPDAVVINLGTNDSGGFNSPAFINESTGEEWKLHLDADKKPVAEDIKLITDALYDFLEKVRRCNSEAQIVYAYGMCDFFIGNYLRTTVEKFAADKNDSRIHFVELDAMWLEKEEEKGSRGHPGHITHRRAAEKISAELKKVLPQ